MTIGLGEVVKRFEELAGEPITTAKLTNKCKSVETIGAKQYPMLAKTPIHCTSDGFANLDLLFVTVLKHIKTS